MANTLLTLTFLVAFSVGVAAQQTIIVVRHAERADAGTGSPTMASDPDLSEAGRARAKSLAAALKDAGISAIYTTEFKRTQQTAQPLARALGIEPTVVPSKDLPALIERLETGAGNALVVGHSNTVGEIVARLGVSTKVKVGDDEYDNLFVVVRGERPSLVRLHFR